MPARNRLHLIVEDEPPDVTVEASFIPAIEATVTISHDNASVTITFEGTDAQTARERLKEWGLAFARKIVEATVTPYEAISSDHPSYGGLGDTPDGATEISGMT